MPSNQPPSISISFRDTFDAIGLTMATIDIGNGIDPWRRQSHEGKIKEINHPLSKERTVPPSKINGVNTGDKKSLWHYFHVNILMPGLDRLADYRNIDQLRRITLSHEEAEAFIHEFPTVCAHIQQHTEFKDEINNFDPSSLPENPEDLSEEDKAFLTNEIEHGHNHLYGRLLQIHYAHKFRSYSEYGLPEETGNYFKGGKKDIVERTIKYAQERVHKCPLISQETGEVLNPIPLGDLIAYYAWLNNIYTVEMITPEYTGAATIAARKLCSLLDFTADTTDLDLRMIDVPHKVAQKLQKDKSLLERINAMTDFLTKHQPQETVDTGVLSRIKSTLRLIAQP